MATLSQIRKKANQRLTTFWATLQQKQDAYFAKHGRYFQLLVTPTNELVGGAEGDFGKRLAHYEDNDGDIDISINTKLPFQVLVHQWQREGQSGYVARVSFKLQDGTIYRRTRDSENNDSGWFIYDPDLGIEK